MAVHLCCGPTDILLWWPKKGDILNVATNTFVMITLLEYSGPMVTEDPVSLPLSEEAT